MRTSLRVIGTLALSLAGTLLVPGFAQGATVHVTDCSFATLSGAVAAANNGDTIDFTLDCTGSGMVNHPVPFTINIIIQDKGLTIDGTGHTIELDGGWAGVNGGSMGEPSGGTSLFTVFTNGMTPFTVTFTNLTFKNGNGFAHGGPAGAISNTRDIVNVNNCTFSGNVGNLGGALFAQNASTFHITGSTFTGNTNPAIPSLNTGVGGAIANDGTMTVTNSTFSGNQITGTGTGVGGAIFEVFGGTGTLTITACTISGNSAGGGNGGGVFGPATVSNSIIYGNTAGTGPDVNNSTGSFSSDGTNLIGTTSGSTGFGGTDIIGLNPLLGTLGTHGGLTQTMPLLPGSPAIDAIAPAGCLTTTDQRAVARPIASLCDIGAFESHGFVPAGSGGTGQSTNINTAFTNPLAVTVTALQAGSPFFEPVAGGQVTFTPPGSGASAALTTSPATISGGGAASVTATANTTGGSYSVLATARGASLTVSFLLTNLAPVVISPLSLTAATYGSFYSQAISATGGTGTGYSFTIGSGTLPAGVTLTTGGSLSGTPTNVGTFNFSVHATDSGTGSANQSYTLIVNPISCIVTSTLDPTDAGHLTLRDAVIAVNASACISDLISFDSTVFPPAGPAKTITLSSGELALTHSATVQGSGARLLTIDANHLSRVFDVNGAALATISSMTLGNGNATNGGAILSGNPLTLVDMSFVSNSAASGGAINSSSSLSISRGTFSGNHASADGGGIRSNGALVISNSTFHGNSAATGHAILSTQSGTASLTNVTVVGNGDGTNAAGVIQETAPSVSTPVTLTNTLLGGNSSPNCAGTISSGGHNIDSDATCSFAGTGDLSGPSVLLNLGSFGNNGGVTDTIALAGGSQAIDTGDGTICTNSPIFASDQRGTGRPQGAGCDIGALEAVQHTLGVTVSGPGSVTASASSPISGGISSCNGSCSAIYSAEMGGDPVTLTASPSTGASFTSWGSGCGSTSGLSASFAMSADHNCTAAFVFLPPTASGGTFTTPFVTPLTQTLTFNDPPGGTLMVNITTPPANGSLTGPDGTGHFTYTPTGTFQGGDSFTFTVTSSVSGLTSSPATVNITVQAPIPPTATGGTFTTPFGTPLSQMLSFTDPSFGTLAVTVTIPPSNGAVAGPDGSGNFTYTPGAAFFGSDSFSFTVTSSVSGLTSGPATVNITVGDPAAPTADPSTVTTVVTTPVLITLRATLPPGSPMSRLSTASIATLTFAIATNPTHGTLSQFDPNAGTVVYSADNGFIGSDSFTFTATYGGQTSAPAAVTVQVNAMPVGVPTLDERALALLALLLVAIAAWRVRA